MNQQLINTGSEPLTQKGNSTMEKLLLTVDEGAELLGISRSFMNRLLYSGQVASLKLGALRRIPRHAIDEYIERETVNE